MITEESPVLRYRIVHGPDHAGNPTTMFRPLNDFTLFETWKLFKTQDDTKDTVIWRTLSWGDNDVMFYFGLNRNIDQWKWTK